jgi:broad specificity phosphatase PhoE
MNGSSLIVFIKHALPVLDASRPPRDWRLSAEGRLQSRVLAERLRAFTPLRLISSVEPKAIETGQIVAEQLDVPLTLLEGLQEFERPALPIMTRTEHERMNKAIFTDFERPVLGTESARGALDRFSRALSTQLEQTEEQTLAIVTHGTVISLFVAAHNAVSPFDLWKRLSCPSIVVMKRLAFTLVDVMDGASDADRTWTSSPS